jgi:DNA polymerase-4
MGMRKIIHVDMDAFFASVEQRDDPSLRGRPVAVGGSTRRGVVAAASYEARAFGVHSAMPSVTAARRCPGLVFVRPRFDVYREVSGRIRGIFLSFTPLVEPLSLDEAYLDVTEPISGPPSATLIARRIKALIREQTGLTASAGVSFNKFLAKVASAARKPDGLTVITPADADAFLEALPVERFFGVGPATARRMHEAGIRTGADIRARTGDEMARLFGKAGRYYHSAAFGIDDRPVRPDRIRKSIGAERTFFEDLVSPDEMLEQLRPVCEEVGRRIAGREIGALAVTLKIKRHDFRVSTRSMTLAEPARSAEVLFRAARKLLLEGPGPPAEPVRLLGVTASRLVFPDDPDAMMQLSLPLGDQVENQASTGA